MSRRTIITCDVCGTEEQNENFFLPAKYSTSKFSFGPHTKSRLSENPSIIVSHPNYIDICNECSVKIQNQIFKEQSE